MHAALQEQVETVVASVDSLINLADPFDGYVRTATITPFIPAVLAALGLKCTMHGVESVGPKHGITAHKVYKLAGIDTAPSVRKACATLERHGWAYIDQRQYAQSLNQLHELRDRLVKRTALTTLERILMPIKGTRETHLVLGYVHKAYPDIYSEVALAAGYDSVLLLKGLEGGLAPAINKPLRRYHVTKSDAVSPQKHIEEVSALFNRNVSGPSLRSEQNHVEQALAVGLEALSGTQGVARDSLTLASANILLSHSHFTSLADAVENVHRCLDNGSAQASFESMIESS